ELKTPARARSGGRRWLGTSYVFMILQILGASARATKTGGRPAIQRRARVKRVRVGRPREASQSATAHIGASMTAERWVSRAAEKPNPSSAAPAPDVTSRT